MISQEHRFHGRGSLRRVYAQGQTVRGPALALKYLANPRRSSYRAAVVVSLKVSKSAVVRNRIRRRLYEVLRRHEPKPGNYDLVFTVFNESLASVSDPVLQKSVAGLLEKAAVLKS